MAAPPRRPDQAEALLRLLYTEYGPSVLNYATRLTGDRGAAEDVVQETLFRAWKHADRLIKGNGSVRGWLMTVARNIVADRARARAIRPVEVAELDERSSVGADHSESVANTLLVSDALDQVSAEHREILVELYYQDRSVAEAARELGVPPGTVKSRSHYALHALRAAIGGREGLFGAETAR
ncbi:RNA polymerase sigma-70 factor (ECF subfamily) [Kribbella orskensis]|uniref:RNA polymerase sigma-70 factor (ECF subfamily) n=1 Tax=Kribbella orskensis TaxID=2512216 RepID=A0ABY2BTR3_9ACTN|nr:MULTISPECIES: sigma-70 family RNA polymerase sigma factor [Kribbella]TCN44783.1 RNA polymerase sigma-70 factor (ECF subfamily) [Kribbella sp. VKM Ac-2500]TCO31439.1 RNA polymerase sigma-70 factor (ECF subfamily) [Kribbella orskensis]